MKVEREVKKERKSVYRAVLLVLRKRDQTCPSTIDFRKYQREP